MPRKKDKVFLEVHNETRLLLFLFARLMWTKQKNLVAQLFVFNRPPDNATYNSDKMQKVLPGNSYHWEITGAIRWYLHNHTRYNPLAQTESIRYEEGRKTFVFRILASNNHISLEDMKILKSMGETIETK